MFSALNHPIRRRIIEMLARNSVTYTYMLEELDIDTGKLNFHLKKLEDLIEKDEKGLYKLTDRGLRAFSIIQHAPEKNRGGFCSKKSSCIFPGFLCSYFGKFVIFYFSYKNFGNYSTRIYYYPFLHIDDLIGFLDISDYF